MSLILLALLLGAEPDVKAATVCMDVAQSQHATCMDVARGYVPVEDRVTAVRACGTAYQRALETCLTSNGVTVTDAQRKRWREEAEVSEALSACFGQVENDFRWCASRVRQTGDLEHCRAASERGFSACKAERDKRLEELASGRKP